MLTDLFCDYSVAIGQRRALLDEYAVSFAQGLQMTNILKDVWEDRSRGACWLPQQVFSRHGIDLERISAGQRDPRFDAGMFELVGVAHAHLRNALAFTLLIPPARDRHPPLLPVGHRAGSADPAEDPADPRIRQRRPGQGVALGRGHDTHFYRHRAAQRLDAARAVRPRCARPAAGEFTGGASGTPARTPQPRTDGRLRCRRAALRRKVGPLNASAVDAVSQAVNALARERRDARTVLERQQSREDASLDSAIASAREALIALQRAAGHWVFELEADCTIPAEYIMMMHFLDEIDEALQAKIAVYLRSHQASHGGWALYHSGDFNISCSVKAYYALKLAGDSPDAPHMLHARQAILEHGGAARCNVFTRIALAIFRPGAMARGPLYSGRDHAAAAVVSVPSRQGVVLVPHGHGAAVHSLHAACERQKSARRAHPRAVHDAARARAPLLSSAAGPRRSAGPVVPAARSRGATHRSADPEVGARASITARGDLVPRAPQRRGWPRRHFSGHGQCARGHGLARRGRRRPAARDRQARAAEAAGGRRVLGLLPAVRLAGMGQRAGCPRHADRGQWRGGGRRRSRARLAAAAAAAGRAWRLAGAAPRSLPAAAGRSSTPMATIPIWTTPRSSPGPCAAPAIQAATRKRLRVRSTGSSACRAATAASRPSTPRTLTTT